MNIESIFPEPFNPIGKRVNVYPNSDLKSEEFTCRGVCVGFSHLSINGTSMIILLADGSLLEQSIRNIKFIDQPCSEMFL